LKCNKFNLPFSGLPWQVWTRTDNISYSTINDLFHLF